MLAVQEHLRIEAQSDYIDDLWFLLHHSEGEDRLVVGLRWYLDDSGSDDGSPLVTCGGLAMSRAQFKGFSERWGVMYKRNQFSGYTLEPPLHMSDFLGSEKYAGLRPEFKRALFRDVVRLINEHKFYSLSVAISQTDFQSEIEEDVRKALIGPYAFAFFSVVLGHQYMSESAQTGPFKASYLVDRGFGHYDQLVEAHRIIVRFEEALGGFRHTGALGEDSDTDVPALQAADAIAWASRKLELAGSLPEGFEPLAEALSETTKHVTIPIDRDGIRMLAKPVRNWISRNGAIPKLEDILVRRTMDGFAVKLKP
ncbi:MAG TPA: hypothetical protein VN841_12710 [Bryobacteraceae bacterium]|nr:hypothetical protein [Bryobacteraceae bacterium]